MSTIKPPGATKKSFKKSFPKNKNYLTLNAVPMFLLNFLECLAMNLLNFLY